MSEQGLPYIYIGRGGQKVNEAPGPGPWELHGTAAATRAELTLLKQQHQWPGKV